MIQKDTFEDIRPLYDKEAKAVLHQLIQHPLFMKLATNLWPLITFEEVQAKAARVDSAMGFQIEFMHPAIRTIVERSSDGLTFSGFENIQPNKAYLFISNHRDILLDSAILQILLVEQGHNTSEITFGNNLMEQGFITNFGRLNRMFTVIREGTGRELYEFSKRLSAYIRHTITEKNVSVWIAQRNGRTKDGLDQTQTGLLKMLSISGNKNLEERMAELKIVPMSISYQYEPCDAEKVQELYLSSLNSKYKKAEGEDLNSIVKGIIQHKGTIHLHLGKVISKNDLVFDNSINDNDKLKQLTNMVDAVINENYKLWDVNYIAADVLQKNSKYSEYYTDEAKERFIKYINLKIEKLIGEKDVLFQLFLKMYANPVYNKMKKE
jgi:hypothetical protein